MSGYHDELVYKEAAERVVRFQNGDVDAFNEFYDLTKRYVYSTIRAIVPTDVDDLVQDVYLKAFTEIKNLDNPMASVKWINTIAYRTALNNKKSAYKRHEQLSQTEDDPGTNEFVEEDSINSVILAPEDIMVNQESQRTLLEFINQLSDDQQQVIRGYFFYDIPLKEVANVMGMSEDTAKSHMYRAKKALRKNIEAYSKRYGIALSSVAAIPVLSMLFHNEVEAAEVPESISISVLAAISKAASDTTAIGAQKMVASSVNNVLQTGKSSVPNSDAHIAAEADTGISNGLAHSANGIGDGMNASKAFATSKIGRAAAVTKMGISKSVIAGIAAAVIALSGIAMTVFSNHLGETKKEYIELTNVAIPMTFNDFEEKYDVAEKRIHDGAVEYSLGEKGVFYRGWPSLGGVTEIILTEEATEYCIMGTHIGMTENEVGTTLLENDGIFGASHHNFVTKDTNYIFGYIYGEDGRANYIDYAWQEHLKPEYDDWLLNAENEQMIDEEAEEANASVESDIDSSESVRENKAAGEESMAGLLTDNQEAIDEFVPFIFQIQEDVENRVTLGATEDVITFHANGDASTPALLTGKINDLDFSIQPDGYVDSFYCAYATDFNTKDGYKNLVVYFIGESDNIEMSICAYNDSGMVILSQQYYQMKSIYGSSDSTFTMIDEQHIPEDGKIILETSSNWRQGDKSAVITREEYLVNATDISKVDSYVGYYSRDNFVEGYPIVLYSDLPVYEDESGTNRVGTIPSGTEVILERGRYNFYLSGGGQSGWATNSDIIGAIKEEGFKGWS